MSFGTWDCSFSALWLVCCKISERNVVFTVVDHESIQWLFIQSIIIIVLRRKWKFFFELIFKWKLVSASLASIFEVWFRVADIKVCGQCNNVQFRLWIKSCYTSLTDNGPATSCSHSMKDLCHVHGTKEILALSHTWRFYTQAFSVKNFSHKSDFRIANILPGSKDDIYWSTSVWWFL